MEQSTRNSGDMHTGLCKECEKLLVCLYPRQRYVPVFNCLEFEELSAAESPRRGSSGTSSRLGVSVRIRAEQREPGLCGICELRHDCTYPRMPSGVWFCEEYR